MPQGTFEAFPRAPARSNSPEKRPFAEAHRDVAIPQPSSRTAWQSGGVESPEHERRQIVEYMATQARDETVEHAEKIASERVFRREYDVWDVHTDAHRWWVVTSPTNLYSQTNFKSMDDVLSYHIGLGIRLVARQARQAPDTPDSRLERTRRQWEQAAEAQNEADEAEEFQAVGMRCRETLVSFAHGMASEGLVPPGDVAPQASNFIAWSDLIANAVASGEGNKRLRGYLKTIAKETWEYVSWLTHAKNATRFDGEMAVSATAHFLSVFEVAIERKESGPRSLPGVRLISNRPRPSPG